MSGGSSGWACEVPTESRDNTEVSKIHFFNMTTPFAMFPAPIIRWWSPAWEIHRPLIARMCASTGREGCGDGATASEKLSAQIQVLRCHAEGRDQHETAKLSNCLCGMSVSPSIGNGCKKRLRGRS